MGAVNRGVKNAFRNSIRTFSIVLILGLSIGLAVAMLMARQAVTQRISEVKSSIGNTISISPAGARGFEGGGEPLTTDEINKVKGIPHVVAVTETVNDRLDSSSTNLLSAIDAGTLGQRQGQFNRRAFGGNSSRTGSFTPPIQVLGSTDLNSLQSFGGGTISLVSGQRFDPTSNDKVALIGKSLADKNSLTVGSNFQAYGSQISVKGIFDSGNTFSNNLIVMPLSTVQTLSGQVNQLSGALVQVDSIDQLGTTTNAIKTTLGSAADVLNQQDTSSQALAPLENIKTVTLYSLVGAIVAGAVIILLTMLMIVRERRREIGVLKAIGATDTKVTAQFIVESVTLTVMGLIVGVGIGALAGNPITRVLVTNSTATTGQFSRGAGQALRFLGGSAANLRSIQTQLGWETILYGIGAALLIAIIGSAIPAFAIARIRPAEVMRSE